MERKHHSHNSDDYQQIIIPNDRVPPFKQLDILHTAVETHFYISGEIGPPDQFIDMNHRLATAGPDDAIVIYLNTIGGQLDTGVQIMNAMRSSQAEVITVMSGMVYSLGSLLFLSGKQRIVTPNSIMMIHNYRGGSFGSGHEIKLQTAATERWFNKLASEVYLPFLSEDELSRMLKGEDIWLLSDDVSERLAMVEEMLANEEELEVDDDPTEVE
jgi:ATP-dependent protease ClpP protease subunit